MTHETWHEQRRRHREEKLALVVAVVRESDGDQTEAARRLKMDRRYLSNFLGRYCLREMCGIKRSQRKGS